MRQLIGLILTCFGVLLMLPVSKNWFQPPDSQASEGTDRITKPWT